MAPGTGTASRWSSLPVIGPIVGLVALAATWGRDLPVTAAVAAALVLAGVVLAAVHHAEVIAARVGEPFGSLTLAVAVTVIEVGLIVTLMVAGGPETATLARDTVFAAVMITCNGIVGLSLIAAARRHGTAVFNAEGSGAALATVATLTTLTLVLPTFTTSLPGPEFTAVQLTFAAIASAGLYLVFVVTQTVRHRDFFLPVDNGEESTDTHADPPSGRAALSSLVLLLISLVVVVGLAKVESPFIEDAVRSAGMPQAVVGVVIALVILLPESLAAVRAARRDRTQVSLNLAFGSAMASIGLTIPTLAIAMLWLEGPLLLGLGPVQLVLFGLTMVVGALTVVPGRATRLQGAVHLAILAAFLVLAASP
jgi:Ca2+:H+ antiporter